MDSEFLKKVASLNEEYCSIRINGELESIGMPFWSFEEIEKGLSLREEWDIPLNLIPFQGDWHEIFCLDQNTGKVIYLNDERAIAHEWKNTQEFLRSLSKDEVAYAEKPKIVSAWLSPELFEKANEFKKKQ